MLHISTDILLRAMSWVVPWLFPSVVGLACWWIDRRGKVKRLEEELAECQESFVNLRLAVVILCAGLGIYMLYASRSAMTRA